MVRIDEELMNELEELITILNKVSRTTWRRVAVPEDILPKPTRGEKAGCIFDNYTVLIERNKVRLFEGQKLIATIEKRTRLGSLLRLVRNLDVVELCFEVLPNIENKNRFLEFLKKLRDLKPKKVSIEKLEKKTAKRLWFVYRIGKKGFFDKVYIHTNKRRISIQIGNFLYAHIEKGAEPFIYVRNRSMAMKYLVKTKKRLLWLLGMLRAIEDFLSCHGGFHVCR